MNAMGIEDYKHVYAAYSMGLAGPYKDYIIMYNLNPPRNKQGRLIKFHEIFKDINDAMHLKGSNRLMIDRDMARKSAIALDMPKELYHKMFGGSDASSNHS